MTAPASDDPYRDHAEQVCALVALETGCVWPERLVDAMALVLNAIADVERGRVRSARYSPKDKMRWLRGETTHDHSSPVLRRLIDIYDLSEPLARQLCHIALGTARFDDSDVSGSSSALLMQLAGVSAVSDRVAQRWAACLARASASGPVAKAATNQLRRIVQRHRHSLPPVAPSTERMSGIAV